MTSLRIYILEALAGFVTGFILLAIFGYLSSLVGALAEPTMGSLVGVIFGGGIGYAAGVPSGISFAGTRLGRPGAFLLALIGSVVGAVLVLALAEPLRLNQNTTVLQITFAVLPLLLALIGYNVRPRPRAST